MEQAQWKLWNTCNADSPNFSLLSLLNDDMRMPDGKFHFKQVWPAVTELESVNEWKQTSNPMVRDNTGVDGYEAISAPNDG